MVSENKQDFNSIAFTIIIWGTVWGIFESTIGYLLHLVSFPYSWLIWYPAACFFLANVYRKSGRISSIVLVGLLCAAIKMLNLFLPGRIDKVINPAISIVFEALAMSAVLFASNCMLKDKSKTPVKALTALGMNTGWRLLYIFYLLFLVPAWIREISVISSAAKFTEFFIMQNLLTSLMIFAGFQIKPYILAPLATVKGYFSIRLDKVPIKMRSVYRPLLAVFMLCLNIALQIILR